MNALIPEVRRLLSRIHAATGERAPRFTDEQIRRALLKTKPRPRKFSDNVSIFTKRPQRFAEIAIPGDDGKEASALLEKAKERGSKVLVEITESALKRALSEFGLVGVVSGKFFNDDELARLTDALTETNVAANLLGRSQVRARMQEPERDGPMLAKFVEQSRVAPMRAIEFFSRLVPMVGASPDEFIRDQEQVGFTMARVTSDTVLREVQRSILRRLTTGEDFEGGPREIQGILENAGLSPKDPNYATSVFRTNMMLAYTSGIDEERRQPDVIEQFPIWRWLGVPDNRQRPKHRELQGNYYPADVTFDSVRGTAAEDVIQCRCQPQLISRSRWIRLRAAGAKIADGYADPVPMAA